MQLIFFIIQKFQKNFKTLVHQLINSNRDELKKEIDLSKILSIFEKIHELVLFKEFLKKISIPTKILAKLIVNYSWNELKDSLGEKLKPILPNIGESCDLIKVHLNLIKFFCFKLNILIKGIN